MNVFQLEGLTQAIGMPGPSELLLILLIVLVVFGHNRIPQLGDALGKGIKNFRKSFAKDETEIKAEQKKLETTDAPVEEKLKQTDDSEVS